jgi:hypothetical protein
MLATNPGDADTPTERQMEKIITMTISMNRSRNSFHTASQHANYTNYLNLVSRILTKHSNQSKLVMFSQQQGSKEV